MASLHTEDRDRVIAEEEDLATMSPGTEFTTEYRVRRRTGELVWVRDRAVLVEDADGTPVMDGIITDISAERSIADASATSVDVYRLTCGACGAVWPAERMQPCPNCGGTEVEGDSLNAALRDLAASRRQVEGLLDGIHKHLEALGSNLRSLPPSLETEAERR
jgi:hypothetical protein